jgi:hypothetical protein
LQGLHPAETVHRPLSASEWLVRIRDLVVQPSPGLLAIGGADLPEGGGVGVQAVGDDGTRATVPLERFLEEFQRRSRVPRLGDVGFQHLALVIDGTPEVVHLAVDLHVDLVEMPPPMREGAHMLTPFPADLASEHRPKPIPPEPHRFAADVDAALEQQLLDVPKRQRIPNVHHDDQPDHLRRGVKSAKWVGRSCHVWRRSPTRFPRHEVCADTAFTPNRT